MKLEDVKVEDLNNVKLPAKIKLKIFLVALPVLAASIIVLIYETVKELLTMPNQVIDLLTLEESLKELMKDK